MLLDPAQPDVRSPGASFPPPPDRGHPVPLPDRYRRLVTVRSRWRFPLRLVQAPRRQSLFPPLKLSRRSTARGHFREHPHRASSQKSRSWGHEKGRPVATCPRMVHRRTTATSTEPPTRRLRPEPGVLGDDAHTGFSRQHRFRIRQTTAFGWQTLFFVSGLPTLPPARG
jgi:hypothetical protein